MLVGVTFENYMSFYNQAQFALTVDSTEERYKDINTFKTPYGRLLKNALVYGANGSGKSNFVDALNFIKTALTISFEAQSKLFAVKNQFRFNTEAGDRAKYFSVTFIIDEVMYDYSFSVKHGKVLHECLDKKVKRTESNVFKRLSSDFSSIEINGREFENVKQFIPNTREDVLFLSLASFMNNDTAKKICKWFEKIKVFTVTDIAGSMPESVKYIQKNEENKKQIIEYLKGAGIEATGLDLDQKAIDEYKKVLGIITDKEINEQIEDIFNVNELGLVVDRNVYNSKWEYAHTIKMKMQDESSGTQKFFRVAGPILDVINNGGVAVIDEIDSKLHPALVKYLVMTFNSISKNPNNAQLICTTHNINLLEEKIRRDQIYFINKNEFGVSDIYCLNEFEGVKKNSKILKQYLLGAFGALPTIEE